MRNGFKFLSDTLFRIRYGQLPIMLGASVFVVLVCLSVIVVDAWRSYSSRSDALLTAEKTSANLARALSQHAEDTIKVADTVLIGLVERLEVDGIHASNARLHSLLVKRKAELPHLHGIFVYDHEGRWIVNSLPVTPANVNNSDREYFIYHRTHADRGPHIGSPVRSRSTGEWIITVTRRINRPDGSFAGVALATIDMAYFQKFYSGFDIGKAGAIFLALDNGIYLARRPFREELIGKSLAGSRLFKEFLPKGPIGTAIIVALADGQERLYAYHHLQSYPLVAFAALSTQEIYAQWLSATYLHSARVILLALVLGILGFRLIGQIRLRLEVEEKLVKAQEAMGKLNKKLEKLALQDGLTGLANRRHFDYVLKNEYKLAQRHGAPLALIMIDVDHFKLFNDIYGHPAGDACLRSVSRLVKASFNRPTDLAARYGGEEIVLLLPDTTQEGALAVAEKIRSSIFDRAIRHRGSPAGVVTVSAGIHVIDADFATHTSMDLVRAADKALYAAKSQGRNRVCCYGSEAALPA